MGLFDFIFNRKKERLAREEAERQEKQHQEELEAERRRKAEEERKKRIAEAAERKRKMEQQTSITPFIFKSSQHQRYENGLSVGGLQRCVRTLTVEKNTNGCKGYKITPGVGYIVRLINDDLGKPQMSDKPMKVISKSQSQVELRGYPLEAMGPFGWMDVDYSDYGLTVYYKEGEVDKCVFHMFDRNVDLEYMRKSNVANTSLASVTKEELQNTMKDLYTLIKYMLSCQTWQTFTLMVDKANITKMIKAGCMLASYYEKVFHFGFVKDFDLHFKADTFADETQRKDILSELSSSWSSVYGMLVNFRMTAFPQDREFVSPYLDRIGKLDQTLFPKLST